MCQLLLAPLCGESYSCCYRSTSNHPWSCVALARCKACIVQLEDVHAVGGGVDGIADLGGGEMFES